jgi:L-aminoadipate-semialdehyde dehydrogenase
MIEEKLTRVLTKFQNLPSISLPTDYPRPLSNKLIEAAHEATLTEQTSLSILKLSLFEDESEHDNNNESSNRPTAFHLLLSAFVVLLHRFTGDTDIIVASSSAAVVDPLLLRISLEPTDPFWAVVRRIQNIEMAAENDALPFETIMDALQKDKDSTTLEGSRPLFRVRFFDETIAPVENFMRSTSLTSDLTIFVTRLLTSSRDSLAPRISLRILYNSLLFTSARMTCIIDQLSTLLRQVSTNPLWPIGCVPLITAAQRTVLPDATANLNWCDWKGAITDVFSRNARQFPERTCVVQSLPFSFPDGAICPVQGHLKFSYGDIHMASNVVAHKLIMGGIQREEVVMVYAHRSVELVVAVMAILKAGAVFSVIGRIYHAMVYTEPMFMLS